MHIFYSLHQLPDYQASFFLPDGSPLLEQASKIEAVRVLLYHVDFGGCLYRLEMTDGVLTFRKTVNFCFFEDSLHINIAQVLGVNYLASVNCFTVING